MTIPAPRTLLAAAALAAAVAVPACGSDVGRGDGEPQVVVTYSILGDVVRQLVGDAARVRVVVPDGQDPHDYEASARDVEAIHGAALIVQNGLGLEAGLVDVLEDAADEGVPVFVATDHVAVRAIGERGTVGDHDGDGGDHTADDGHDHDGGDPHIWTDPLLMADVAPALGAELERALGLELDERVAAFQAAMADVDAQVRTIMAAIPAGECRLVTGHESLGYFAARYGCTVVGAVIPSLSSSAETSARALAELHGLAADAGVRAVFTEAGTPTRIAEEVADAVGVDVVELPSHDLPDEGGYAAYLVELASRIAAALTARD